MFIYGSYLSLLRRLFRIVHYSEKALRETGEAGLEEALEWIETHQKNFNTNMKKSEVQPAVAQGNSIVEFVEEEKSPKPSSIEAPQAMSFKCDV